MRMNEAPTSYKGSQSVRVRLREDAEVNQRRQRGDREETERRQRIGITHG
jgi:hypothetical protein